MFKKLICLILIIKLAQADLNFIPKSFGYNSAIIIDTDKSQTPNNNVFIEYLNKIRQQAPYSVWQKYPSHDLPPPLSGSIPAADPCSNDKIDPVSTTTPIYITSTSTTTTTTTPEPTTTTTTPEPATTTTTPEPATTTTTPEPATTTTTPEPTTTTTTPEPSTTTTTPEPATTTTTPEPTTTTTTTEATTSSITKMNDNEYPKELLDIAQTKLNLKNPDEIPSISELGQLLGTNTPEDTLNHIKQLTSNEQGVALMRAYIESTDYTDNSGNLENKNDDLKNKNDIGGIEETAKANYESLVDITDESSNNNYERGDEVDQVEGIALATTIMPSYTFMKKYNNKINIITHITGKKFKPIPWTSLDEQSKWAILEEYESNNKLILKSPLLVDDLTVQYPAPFRAESTTTTTTTPSSSSTISLNSDNTPVVHLNTPKMIMPHVEHLARITKIPTKNIENFLAKKPKFLELAAKVSPIGYGRNSPIEAQVIAALQKAIEHDEDLKKLVHSTDTLK